MFTSVGLLPYLGCVKSKAQDVVYTMFGGEYAVFIPFSLVFGGVLTLVEILRFFWGAPRCALSGLAVPRVLASLRSQPMKSAFQFFAIFVITTWSVAQVKTAYVRCESNGPVGVWADADFRSKTADLKCNDEVQVVSIDSTVVHVITKKKKIDGYMHISQLSTAKMHKPSKGGRIAAAILLGMAAGAAGAAGATSSGTSFAGAPKLMLFGGQEHKTYLGCLNCSEYASDSIMNKYGTHGSKYSSDSIFNQYSDYGSHYSSYGACNPYATDPPVIVDSEGKYYGRMTLNRYHSEIGLGTRYFDWLSGVCHQS